MVQIRSPKGTIVHERHDMTTHYCTVSILVACLTISFQSAATPRSPVINYSPSVTNCTQATPLNPDAPGSPTRLIELPNRDPGVSALAALMRTLFNELKAQKTALENSGQLTPLTSFEQAPCIWPTDLSTRTPKFDGFSKMMSSKIQVHNQKPTKDSYSSVIEGCLSCHEHYCAGHVPAIRCLRLSNASPAPTSDACGPSTP